MSVPATLPRVIKAYFVVVPILCAEIYILFHAFLKVPVGSLAPLFIVAAVAPMVVGPMIFYAAKYSSNHSGDNTMIFASIYLYLIGLTVVGSYYAVKFGLVRPLVALKLR
jgi:hypothetical protein